MSASSPRSNSTQGDKNGDIPEFLQYLQAWWYANSPDANEQPAPMTYEEIMNLAPRRRPLSNYADALDDGSSSGDEGYDLEPLHEDDETFQENSAGEQRRDDNQEQRDDISKVLALHHDLNNSRDGEKNKYVIAAAGEQNIDHKTNKPRLQRVSSH